MSFTEDEKISIAKIVRMTPTLLDAHLTSLGAALTAEKETAVRAEITRWTDGGVSSQFSSFTPTESNQGFNLDSGDAKNDVRGNIRLILEISGGSYSGNRTICVET